METKIYPKKGMTVITTSTNVVCAKCKQPTGIYEAIYKDDNRDVYYHMSCVSDGEKETAAETKVVELKLTDDLNVKSEGR